MLITSEAMWSHTLPFQSAIGYRSPVDMESMAAGPVHFFRAGSLLGGPLGADMEALGLLR